ncbi:MAG: hypothetical protein AB1540_07185 [Bdellovibrionota bacterium]
MKEEASTRALLKAPAIRRRLKFWRHQWVAVPLLLAIPILAVSGVFGEKSWELTQMKNDVRIRVKYPERFRYNQLQPIEVVVENLANTTLKDVEVRFDTAYINKFSNVSFIPEPHNAYRIKLNTLGPKEQQEIAAEIQAKDYGKHAGSVEVLAEGAVLAKVDISTIVFP